MSDLLCVACGAKLDGAEVCPKCNTAVTLETYGLSIKPAERGGGFMLYKGEDPVEIVRESKKWMVDIAHSLNVRVELLKSALIKAKATPKPGKAEAEAPKPLSYEIIKTTINRIPPDAGVVDGRAYVGLWLPCKYKDPDTGAELLREMFHLLFSDGEIIPADEVTLAKKGLYLLCKPIYTPPKITVEQALELARLGHVDAGDLLNRLIEQFRQYLEFGDERLYLLFALWTVGTYFYRRFAAYPYLYLNALKRSGKTKALTLLNLLCYNSVFSTNMSTAALFRIIQNAGSSVMIDETEKLSNPERAEEFRTLLLSGYKRGGVVYRIEEDEAGRRIPTPFEVYAPKALAMIRGLEDVLEDRTILVTMKRGKNRAIINRDVPLNDPVWPKLRAELTRLWLHSWAEVEAEYTTLNGVCSEHSECSVDTGGVEKENKYIVLQGRDLELWKPLLAISIYFSEFITPSDTTLHSLHTLHTLEDAILSLAQEITAASQVENATEMGELLLVQVLLKLVTADSWHTPKTMHLELSALYDGEVPKWMTARWIGGALRRLGFKDKRRVGRGIEYHLTPDQVQDMADRLGVKLEEEKTEPFKPPAEKGSLVSALLRDIEGNGEVGELYPRDWLEIHGIPRTEAEEIIVGLRDAGKIIRTKGGWKT
jgi:hypothetical protein